MAAGRVRSLLNAPILPIKQNIFKIKLNLFNGQTRIDERKMKKCIPNCKVFVLAFFWLLLVGCKAEIQSSPTTVVIAGPTMDETMVIQTQSITKLISPSPSTIFLTQEKPETSTPSSSPTLPAPLFQFTFLSDRSNQFGLYGIDVYCLDFSKCMGKPHLLFVSKDEMGEYDWSPDGKKIAYSSMNGKLFLSDWDGKNSIQVTDDLGFAGWPQWSPSGSQIAFIYNPRCQECEYFDPSQIQILNLNTGKITRILDGIIDPSRVDWLNESTIAFIAQKSLTERSRIIEIVELGNGESRLVLEHPEMFTNLLNFEFSQNSEKMVFSGETYQDSGGTATDIYIFDSKGNNTQKITDGIGDNFNPAWIPLEDIISFQSDMNRNYDIYLIRSDGTSLYNVTQNTATDSFPGWRPSTTK